MEGINMTSSTSTVLITGATGFLGTEITKRLLKNTNHQIIVLVRGIDPLNRLSRAWWEYPELIDGIDRRIHVYLGDITKEQFDLDEKDYKKLTHSVTHIIHTAADLRLNAPLIELRKTNVEGTGNVLKLAYHIHIDHGLKRFSHISTAYVAGAREGSISEDSLTDDYGFRNNYEKTKFESELLVKNSNLPVSIFRPGMIVGDSQSGYIKTFNTLYAPLKLYLTGKQRILPVKSNVKINLVPIDYVVDCVIRLTFNKDAEGLTFHLTAPVNSQPTVDELIKTVRKWVYQKLNYKLPQPLYLPLISLFIPNLLKISFLNFKTRRLLETLNTLMPYFNENREYLRINTDKFMGEYELDWRIYLPHLLEFAIYYGFFHRSPRTVYEQIYFRIKSISHPVEYYDIIDGEFQNHSSKMIGSDIESAVRSLTKLGVNDGDRVALVGYNSTRYLTLDVAIGLIGAISVPLYYTSSTEELKEIIDDCQAKILFIDNPELINKLQFHDEITLISFNRDDNKLPPDILGWSEFLEYGDDNTPPPRMVSFTDIATIRYTSGTTGKPRGVTFNHANLRWMAEYIASMPPWKDRINNVSYLSFLPMNHVVEGILAMYSPYYAPTKLKLYYLENFQDLPQIMPLVKPTIFFSVPRFYEKLWSTLINSKIGICYLKKGNGLHKKVLKYLLRHVTLKRAGLNKCAQLIVGSAPISIDLLKDFQDLGIEIYNAYGLTEAPLVTINRIGLNRIKTVGEPLPSTRIQIARDGEVMVQGPQVTPGYYNSEESPFSDDWLLTGDYGYLTEQSSLVITGRKKELLVNSYGKSVSPYKIESMIRDISGVTEALLVGEGKPYLSALIWMDEPPVKNDTIIKAIEMINNRISRPEEIKKIVILKNKLTIEEGDLTANFKIKRVNVLKHYKKVLDYLYDDLERPSEIYYHHNMGDGLE
jgi:long-chain acyl-CoA synthetase